MNSNALKPYPAGKPEHFGLDFSDGVRVEIMVDIARIHKRSQRGIIPALPAIWSGPRKPTHFAPYLEWIKTVWQQVSDLSGRSICSVVVPPAGKALAIEFHPGRPCATRLLQP